VTSAAPGERAQRCERLRVVRPAQDAEAADDERKLVERRRVRLLEPPPRPARRRALEPSTVAQRVQRDEVERLGDRESTELARGRLGDDQVLALDRSTEDALRMALGGRAISSPGAGAATRA